MCNIYSRLSSLNDYENCMVSTKVTIRGVSGATNDFDVFYQFKHLNIECKVVIECKDWKSAVSVVQVRDFASKIEDVGIGQYMGVMVSKNGYQEGALTYAKPKGITLLTESQLPSIHELLAGIIKKGFLPDEKVNGQPFWTLMEVRNGETTGTYYAYRTPELTVPFFYSKFIAEKMLTNLPDSDRFEVRGVSQYQLKSFIAQMRVLGIVVGIYYLPYWTENVEEIPFIEIGADELEREYIL